MIHKKIATQTFIGQDKICLSFMLKNSNQTNWCDGRILYSDNTSTKMMHDFCSSYFHIFLFLRSLRMRCVYSIFFLFSTLLFHFILTNSRHAYRLLTRILCVCFFTMSILVRLLLFFFVSTSPSHWSVCCWRAIFAFSQEISTLWNNDDGNAWAVSTRYFVQNYTL